jgi:putative endonuclease
MLSKGHAYERIAEQFLSKKGYLTKTRNYHTKQGEIDLVMQNNNTIVFVEVRYRKSNMYGSAEESITKTKQAKIILSAKHYMTKFKAWNMDARFDVITIKPSSSSQLEINWLKDAFN